MRRKKWLLFDQLMSAWPLMILGLGLLLPARAARALQPLGEFLAAAQQRNPDMVQARAIARQREAEAKAAAWRLGPSLDARAGLTRNEYQADATLPPASPGTAPRSATVQALQAREASVEVDLPLIDVASLERAASAGSASAWTAKSVKCSPASTSRPSSRTGSSCSRPGDRRGRLDRDGRPGRAQGECGDPPAIAASNRHQRQPEPPSRVIEVRRVAALLLFSPALEELDQLLMARRHGSSPQRGSSFVRWSSNGNCTPA